MSEQQIKRSKHRLRQLMIVARISRGWTLKKLASVLGRDPSNLIPASGVPKLDLVLRLAEVLDWSPSQVIERLEPVPEPSPLPCARDAAAALREASEAQAAGRFDDAVRLSAHAALASDVPNERAAARRQEADAWSGLGRFNEAIRAARLGLDEHDAAFDRRARLRATLARLHGALGRYDEAQGVATVLLGELERRTPASASEIAAGIIARAVRGHCLRSRVDEEPGIARTLAASAIEDLATGMRRMERVEDPVVAAELLGLREACGAGILEMEALLGRRAPMDVIAMLLDGLDGLIDGSAGPVGEVLTGLGWTCVSGFNVALRHLDDEARSSRYLGIFSNVAIEIADRSGNWSLCERVWRLEHRRRQRLRALGSEDEWVLDEEDVRRITACMGGNPSFLPVGWSILSSATIVWGSTGTIRLAGAANGMEQATRVTA